MSQDERLAAAEAENRRLRQQLEAALAHNALLLERVQELEGRLAKDSPTSGKPPARDGLARQTQRLRHKSGKQPGGQVGHPGETLRLGATPDTVVVHRPAVCAHGQRPLEGEPVVGRERRQGHELPPVRLVVPEHQARQVRCPAC